MCIVSNVSDYARDYLPKRYPWAADQWERIPSAPSTAPAGVSKKEFENLKREVAELKKLLLAAKKFDGATGQHDCEQEDKVSLLKRIAKLVGVDLSEVFDPSPTMAA